MDIIDSLKQRKEAVWLNPGLEKIKPGDIINGYKFVHTKAAQSRFMRFMPYLAMAFPETSAKKGVIESPLLPLPAMQKVIENNWGPIGGRLYLKDDARLPVAGSVKARGGIHEVLKTAEQLAMKEGLLKPGDDYSKIGSEEFRDLYSQYTIQVGSTGNLGISIGRTAARLGFNTIVHMSSDAKEWKIKLLESEGVSVRKYDGDYSLAVKEGREASSQNEKSFFVDDENSEDLFFGYSTAAMRVSVQLRKLSIPVDSEHPLFLYLPCGVGGAPGGITFGFKQLFGDNVHCFFAEPVEAPCFTLGMASGKHSDICVQEIGLSGKTVADGLAVGRPSGFACDMMEHLMSGAFTVTDEHVLQYQRMLKEAENIYLEPSACAGFYGITGDCRHSAAFEEYIDAHGLKKVMDKASHIVWGTGGGLHEEW